jgi:hypothetical protein
MKRDNSNSADVYIDPNFAGFFFITSMIIIHTYKMQWICRSKEVFKQNWPPSVENLHTYFTIFWTNFLS